MAINDPSLKPFADGLRLTDTDPTDGQFCFDSSKLAEVVTPQIVDNVQRQFPSTRTTDGWPPAASKPR
jgi:hypothetical protein